MRTVARISRCELDRIDRTIAGTQQNLAAGRARLDELTRPRLFRRPDRHAIDATRKQISSGEQYLAKLLDQRPGQAAKVERSEGRLQRAEADVARIPDVEAAIARRSEWISDHVPELEWEHDLAERLGLNREPEHDRSTERGDVGQDHGDGGPEEGWPDLRTIDLSPPRPASRLDRRLEDALGLVDGRRLDPPRPPLPGRGIDGPDLGMGL